MFTFNKDQEMRDRIIAPYYDADKSFGGTRHYINMPLEILEKLVALKFAEPEETQNDSPSIAEFIEYMKEHPYARAHGYTVGLDRSDYRVSVEGLMQEEHTDRDEEIEFLKFNRSADELDTDPSGFRSWWD